MRDPQTSEVDAGYQILALPELIALHAIPRPVRLRQRWPAVVLTVLSLAMLLPTIVGFVLIDVAMNAVIVAAAGSTRPLFDDAVVGWPCALLVLLFAVAWTSMLCLFYWAAWHRYLLHFRLATSGSAMVGTVVKKRTISTGSIGEPGYEITFSHAGATSTMRIGASLFDQLAPGDFVPVLFSPKRPKEAVIYDACEFEILPPNSTNAAALRDSTGTSSHGS